VINKMKSREGEGEVRDRFGIDGPLAGIQNRRFQILKDFYFQDTLRMDSATYACDNFDLDVLMVYFHGVDAVQHHFWKQREIEGSVFRDTIASYHVFMDEILGEIIKMIPGEKTVFVTSDHGHGPVKWHHKIFSPELLRQKLEGTHSGGEDGIFIASGNGVKEGESVKDVFICDVVPTMLALMGLPVAKDMDGRPVTEIFEDAVSPVAYTDTYEGKTTVISGRKEVPEEDQMLLQRLRDLGYME
jgi:hypothetical protein